MPNTLTRLILFLSSYAPLFLIIAMRCWSDSVLLAFSLTLVATLSVAILFVFLRVERNLAAEKIVVESAGSRDGDAMSYIVTYLLPFLAVKFNVPIDVTSLAAAFLVIAVIYISSNMIYTNPVLNLAGYHIFEIQDADGKTSALICKRPYVRTHSEMEVISLGNYVLLEKD